MGKGIYEAHKMKIRIIVSLRGKEGIRADETQYTIVPSKCGIHVKTLIIISVYEGMGKGTYEAHRMKIRIIHLEVTLVHEEACEHITIYIFLHYVI